MSTKQQGYYTRHKLLAFLLDYYAEHGYPASIREMMPIINARWPDKPYYHLQALVDSGYVQHSGFHQPRTYVPANIVGEAWINGQRKLVTAV